MKLTVKIFRLISLVLVISGFTYGCAKNSVQDDQLVNTIEVDTVEPVQPKETDSTNDTHEGETNLAIANQTAELNEASIEDIFTPDSDLEDNYFWIEGVFNGDSVTKTEEGYSLVLLPWYVNPTEDYESLTINLTDDMVATWNKTGTVISLDELMTRERDRLIKVAIFLNEDRESATLTGEVTTISLMLVRTYY